MINVGNGYDRSAVPAETTSAFRRNGTASDYTVGNGHRAVPRFYSQQMGTARGPFPTHKKPHTFVCGQKKKDILSDVLVLALPIFTARHQATIVGVSELNFCVRDGNRWTLTTINTNSHRMAFHHPLYKALSGLLNVPHILHFSFFMCLHASFSW